MQTKEMVAFASLSGVRKMYRIDVENGHGYRLCLLTKVVHITFRNEIIR